MKLKDKRQNKRKHEIKIAAIHRILEAIESGKSFKNEKGLRTTK